MIVKLTQGLKGDVSTSYFNLSNKATLHISSYIPLHTPISLLCILHEGLLRIFPPMLDCSIAHVCPNSQPPGRSVLSAVELTLSCSSSTDCPRPERAVIFDGRYGALLGLVKCSYKLSFIRVR